MIRHDLFNRYVGALKKQQGAENVIVARDGSGVLVKNFMMPGEYKEKETMIYLEIPEGFGYGVNVSNAFLLLDRGKSRHHLIAIDNVAAIVKRKFNVVIEKKALRKRNWHWICFHPVGDHLYHRARGDEEDKKPRGGEEAICDFLDFLLMVKAVLSGIEYNDRSIIAEVEDMNSRREDILLSQKEWIESVRLSKGWRKIRWLYD